MNDHLRDPKAISWEDLQDELGFTEEERARIDAGARRLVALSRAYRLAEVRRRQRTTQVEVAKAMGVTQARVSRIEKGQLERTEVETLAAYVQALGGKLTIVAEFGDEQYLLGS
jgi:DNA-binding Xre family transcriptional regulator